MPPVNGGAVQTLVDCFVNSANAKFDIDVYSFSSNENTRINNVNYYYVSYNGIFDKFEKFFRFVFNKLFKKYIGNLYIKKLVVLFFLAECLLRQFRGLFILV